MKVFVAVNTCVDDDAEQISSFCHVIGVYSTQEKAAEALFQFIWRTTWRSFIDNLVEKNAEWFLIKEAQMLPARLESDVTICWQERFEKIIKFYFEHCRKPEFILCAGERWDIFEKNLDE